MIPSSPVHRKNKPLLHHPRPPPATNISSSICPPPALPPQYCLLPPSGDRRPLTRLAAVGAHLRALQPLGHDGGGGGRAVGNEAHRGRRRCSRPPSGPGTHKAGQGWKDAKRRYTQPRTGYTHTHTTPPPPDSTTRPFPPSARARGHSSGTSTLPPPEERRSVRSGSSCLCDDGERGVPAVCVEGRPFCNGCFPSCNNSAFYFYINNLVLCLRENVTSTCMCAKLEVRENLQSV